jgi:hypothetical protein
VKTVKGKEQEKQLKNIFTKDDSESIESKDKKQNIETGEETSNKSDEHPLQYLVELEDIISHLDRSSPACEEERNHLDSKLNDSETSMDETIKSEETAKDLSNSISKFIGKLIQELEQSTNCSADDQEFGSCG